jgi:glycosyltransferase involved in cell wall biosynthesis
LSPGSPVAEVNGSAVATGASAGRVPLRVCHVASGDLWAGAEVQMATLLRALARRSDLRLFAILFNEGRLAEEIRAAGVPVMVIPESRHSVLGIVARARDFTRRERIDILHAHGYKENFVAAWVSRLSDVAHVVRTQHGAPEPYTGWKRAKQVLTEALDRFTTRYVTDRVICVSRRLARRMRHYAAPQQLVTVHNGIEVERVHSPLTPAEARRRLGLPETAEVVGTAGRLVPVKRLDIFLQAARWLANARPETHFVIAGSGPEEARLRGLANSLGLTERVVFPGYRNDVHDVLRAMDIFVISSDHEGLPMVLLEAMALGVPVVSRAVGGIPEVIEDGRSGLLVGTAEPEALAVRCAALLADAGERELIAARAATRVASEFSAQRTADEILRLYETLAVAR